MGCLLQKDHRLEGLKRILNPLSFSRPAEFREALYHLAPSESVQRVLDIGSPKLPVVILLKERPGLELYATDIIAEFAETTAAFLSAAGFGERIGSAVHLQQEDARRLSFEDGYFDWVYSISVLEHVADEAGDAGDTLAIQEVARVLRPGGCVTITVPFDASGYREEYVRGGVYERSEVDGQSTFYQRHYDDAALRERLIVPSGLECEAIVYLGENAPVAVEPWWNQIPMKLKVPFLPFQGLVGNLLFSRLPTADVRLAKGVALRLRKQKAA
ncbi:MAG TPA: class I SAM-dependent methyltransferase [Dehalococcoidia bacterium]|nr:class I SAM-dependent methyltransferase [Dehalococcoidia bacterium]